MATPSSSNPDQEELDVQWTQDKLDQTLYISDKENTSPIIEFMYVRPTTTTTSSTAPLQPTKAPANNAATASEGENENGENNEENGSEEDVPFEPAYIDIPIQFDDVHIIKFYAEWCPHCQHYKPIYVKLAREIKKRSVDVNVFFHAVSCTLNDDTCSTYDIEGYPTFMGYRGGGRTHDSEEEGADNKLPYANLIANTTMIGTYLEMNGNLNHDIELVASTMEFDLVSVERDYSKSESKYSNSQDQRDYEERKRERSREAAKEKVALLDTHVSLNELYHDSLLSLTFILQKSVYYQSHSGKMKKESEISALHDFLKLAHWATPLKWDMQQTYIKHLVDRFESDVIQGKERLLQFVEQYTLEKTLNGKKRSRLNLSKKYDPLPWGYIDAKEPRKHGMLKRRHATNNGLGQDAPSRIHHHDNDNEVENALVAQNKWTNTCSHGPTSRGFTCGLWELFHIMTIGSTMTSNQLFGYTNGYLISSHEVAGVSQKNDFFFIQIHAYLFTPMHYHFSISSCIYQNLFHRYLFRTFLRNNSKFC